MYKICVIYGLSLFLQDTISQVFIMSVLKFLDRIEFPEAAAVQPSI